MDCMLLQEIAAAEGRMHAAAAEAEAKAASLTAALSAAKDDVAALQETVKLQAAELARHQARNYFHNRVLS